VAEGQILHHPGVIGLVHECRGAEFAAALGVLTGQKMAFSGAIPHDFARAGDFEPLGYRLARLD
jgi:hypothetical protein